MRLVLILAVAFAAALLAPLAHAQSCAASMPTQLVVRTFDSTPVDVKADLTSRELTRRSRGSLGGKLLGKTEAQFAYRTLVEGDCSETIVVELHLVKQVVSVASDLPTDSCTYRETVAHEMEHVAINRQVLQDVKVELERSFGPGASATASELLKVVTDRALPVARQRFSDSKVLHLNYDSDDRHAPRTAECSRDLAARTASL